MCSGSAPPIPVATPTEMGGDGGAVTALPNRLPQRSLLRRTRGLHVSAVDCAARSHLGFDIVHHVVGKWRDGRPRDSRGVGPGTAHSRMAGLLQVSYVHARSYGSAGTATHDESRSAGVEKLVG